jgi:chromosome segregation ATPase
MSDQLKFLNAYSEVVNDNLNSIIKQNMVFQTQLKLAQEQLDILDDAKKTADRLSVENRQLQDKVNELINLTSSYKDAADDKSRLQVSLNETSQVKNQLQSTINDMQQEILRLTNKLKDYDELKKENNQLKKKSGGSKVKDETPNTF